jgi:hypothetical protein
VSLRRSGQVQTTRRQRLSSVCWSVALHGRSAYQGEPRCAESTTSRLGSESEPGSASPPDRRGLGTGGARPGMAPRASPKSLHGRRVRRGYGWLLGVTPGERSGEEKGDGIQALGRKDQQPRLVGRCLLFRVQIPPPRPDNTSNCATLWLVGSGLDAVPRAQPRGRGRAYLMRPVVRLSGVTGGGGHGEAEAGSGERQDNQ